MKKKEKRAKKEMKGEKEKKYEVLEIELGVICCKFEVVFRAVNLSSSKPVQTYEKIAREASTHIVVCEECSKQLGCCNSCC